MRACRSPEAFGPPSMGVFGPNGYGPLSLSLAYRNFRWMKTCVFGLMTVHGIPYG